MTFRSNNIKQYISLTIDCLKVLQLTHSKHFVHRDISAGNVAIQDGKGMIIDFGGARKLLGNELKTGVKYPGLGTPKFFSSHYLETGYYCFQDDLESLVYSILFSINNGSLPFDEASSIKEMKTIKKNILNYLDSMPKFLQYLIKYVRTLKNNEMIDFPSLLSNLESLL